jgi:NADH pyrophosphatase NudC (nudix superfamily)
MIDEGGEEARREERGAWVSELEKIQLRWEEQKERSLREDQRRHWWDPWIRSWNQIGEEVALPRARSLLLETIAAHRDQLEDARGRRLAEGVAWSGVYPICRSCGHRMVSRDHRCSP